MLKFLRVKLGLRVYIGKFKNFKFETFNLIIISLLFIEALRQIKDSLQKNHQKIRTEKGY